MPLARLLRHAGMAARLDWLAAETQGLDPEPKLD